MARPDGGAMIDDGWGDSLPGFAGPADSEGIDLCGGAKAKVDARVFCGKIAAVRPDFSDLHPPVRRNLHPRADGCPSARRADVQLQPMAAMHITLIVQQ